MLTNLLYFLLFETFEPSYGTLVSSLPPRIVASAIAQDSLLSLGNPLVPVKKTESLGPVLDAQSYFSIDVKTGTPLAVHDIFARRSMASITKLVTAMVILDTHGLEEKVIVSRAATEQEGSRMELRPGEEITVGSLMQGLLIASGNDAAVALAEYDAGSEANFVGKMNAKAHTLGLRDTHFSNAKGFDDADNYSTAFDILLFSRAALDYPFIRTTAATKKLEVTSFNGKIRHTLETTDDLLENEVFKFKGLKTGTTPLAGESFVSLFETPDGREILSVVLASPHRFKETKILLDWIVRNFEFPRI